MIHILWDAAHIWGILALRAMRVLSVPHRLVKASEIAQRAFSCKPPSMLMVPGGSARLKAAALGEAGRAAIRDYVAGGGQYLGFCGGAGLALSGSGGLDLCPWSRAGYADRLQHLMSGHVRVTPSRDHLAPDFGGENVYLPVWWPGRFNSDNNGEVRILARYEQPHDDFWLVDLPLADLPPGIIAEWEGVYGFAPRPDFLAGQPCLVHGKYGLGSYTLSYAHLETPGSPQANRWLVHLLRELGGIGKDVGDDGSLDATIEQNNSNPLDTTIDQKTHLETWDILAEKIVWPHTPLTEPVLRARREIEDLLDIVVKHNLLFRRAGWLFGWRAGLPGAAMNNFITAICTAPSLPLNDAGLELLARHKNFLDKMLPIFNKAARSHFMAERLAGALPDFMDKKALKSQGEALFGQPMQGGGLCGELLEVLDELIFVLAATRIGEDI